MSSHLPLYGDNFSSRPCRFDALWHMMVHNNYRDLALKTRV